MKKVVLVTSLASKKSIMKYQNLPLIGIERGIELIAKCNLPIALGIGDFDTLDYELVSKYLKPNQIVRLKKEKLIFHAEGEFFEVVVLFSEFIYKLIKDVPKGISVFFEEISDK